MKKYEKPKFYMIRFESLNDITNANPVSVSVTLANESIQQKLLEISNILDY